MNVRGPGAAAPAEGWETRWMPRRPFRLPAGALLDLSVGVEEEALLRRGRWQAGVYVGLPAWFEPEDRHGLINFVDAHLTGRQPLTSLRAKGLLVGFAVRDDSIAVRHDVERFALSFADEKAFGHAALHGMESTVQHVDFSPYEHLFPEEMRAID